MSLNGKPEIDPIDRATRERDEEVDRIKTASRQRVAALAAEGKGLQALGENAKLLGIDVDDILRGGERPKLIEFGQKVRLRGKVDSNSGD
jgi:hypothetical protein